jgi:photosystem II cytochrome b559 subunit alpha
MAAMPLKVGVIN